MTALGAMYDQGRGVEQDERQAMIWYRRAAEAGDTEAMRLIGEAYYDGVGLPQNSALAREWLQRAAAGGNDEAATRLSMPEAGSSTGDTVPAAVRARAASPVPAR
jgi:TPR repeat protein